MNEASLECGATFWKGRVAFYHILKAMGVGAGDEVILPAFTCVAVPSAIVYLGAKPVYVDIEAATFNMDASLLASKISSRTKVVVAQHTFGLPAPMDAIRHAIAASGRAKQIKIVEDCAHAFGSMLGGVLVGSLGDAAFFSMQWSKPFTTGLGGVAVTGDESLRQQLAALQRRAAAPDWRAVMMLRAQYAVHAALYRPRLFWVARGAYRFATRLGIGVGSSSAEELEIRQPRDYGWRASGFQSRLMREQIAAARRAIVHRKTIVALYEAALSEAGFELPRVDADCQPVFLRYPILVADKTKALEQARQAWLEIGDWFVSPLHPNRDGWQKVKYRRGECPVAEKVCAHVINLPTHRGVSEAEAARVLDFVRRQVPLARAELK
jgi:dTDP-4-amino-4,6-dideoxygalactose transaminase